MFEPRFEIEQVEYDRMRSEVDRLRARVSELEQERRECLEQDPPMTGHHSYLTERLRELESDR